jgi:hypothetical protein
VVARVLSSRLSTWSTSTPAKDYVLNVHSLIFTAVFGRRQLSVSVRASCALL